MKLPPGTTASPLGDIDLLEADLDPRHAPRQIFDGVANALFLLDDTPIGDGFPSQREQWIAYMLEAIEAEVGDAEIVRIRDLCAQRFEQGSW